MNEGRECPKCGSMLYFTTSYKANVWRCYNCGYEDVEAVAFWRET